MVYIIELFLGMAACPPLNTLLCVCETASDPSAVEKYSAKPEEIIQRYSSVPVHHHNVAIYCEGQFCSVLGDLHKAALDEIGVWAAYEVAKMVVADLGKLKGEV